MPQIVINLLPPTVQSQRAAARAKWQLPSGLPRTIGLSVAGVLGALILALLVIGGIRHFSAVRVKREWDNLAPKRQELVKLQAEQTRLEARFTVLSKLMDGRHQWAPHLNRIADGLPDGVWLTRLLIESPSKLTLDGEALERSGEGMQTLSRFLTVLQSDKTFTSVFNKITLQSFTTRTVGALEMLDFSIVCVHLEPVQPVEPPKTKGKGATKAKTSGKTTPQKKK